MPTQSDDHDVPPFSAPNHALLSHVLSLGPGPEQDAFFAGLAEFDPAKPEVIRSLMAASEETEWHARFIAAKGERVGEFVLVEPIEKGGFGSVWLAKRDEDRTPAVAVKLLHTSKMSEMSMARFEREREALRQIHHPGVVRLVAEGNHEGVQPYLALEHVDGVAIDRFVDKHGLDVEERVELLIQTARAAHATHEMGIVHRDIKPGNVLVASTSDGPHVTLIDFGLAHAIGDRNAALEIGDTGAHTQLGTLGYMPPEQSFLATEFLGRDLDARTDVFALGRLAFTVLTGAPAVDLGESESPVQLGKLHDCYRHGPPARAVTRAAGLTDDLDAVLRRAQQTDPKDRYATAAELALDLERVLRGDLPLANRQNRKAALRHFVRRYAVAMTAAAVIFSLLVSVIVVLYRSEQRAIRDREQLQSAVAAYEDVFDNVSPRDLAIHLREDLLEQGKDGSILKFESIDFTTAANRALKAKVLRPAIDQVDQLPPEVQPRMLDRYARLALRFGDLPLASELVERALEVISATKREQAEVGIDLRLRQAAFHSAGGRSDEARAVLAALRTGEHGSLTATQSLRVRTEELGSHVLARETANLSQLADGVMQALDTDEELDARHERIALANAGAAYFEAGDYGKAKPIIERAIEMIEAAPVAQIDDRITARIHLANVNSALELHDEACRDLDDIDRDIISFHGRVSRRRFQFLTNRTKIEEAAGNVEATVAALEESAKVMDNLPHVSPLERLIVLTNARIMLIGQGVPEKARAGLDGLIEEARAVGPYGAQIANGLRSVDIFARAEMGERETLESEFAPLVDEMASFGPSAAQMHRDYLERIVNFYEVWQSEGPPRDLAPDIERWQEALDALQGAASDG